jgi:pSer/pThr/pTyr-binding forkhead associated (FHA) protein
MGWFPHDNEAQKLTREDHDPGAWVNGYRLKKSQNYPLQNGDRLQFCKTVLVFVKRSTKVSQIWSQGSELLLYLSTIVA